MIEWNVARQAKDGTLWDIFEDEFVSSYEDAKAAQENWYEGIERDSSDPIVIIKRTAPVKAGPWEVVA